jgi:serine/threonine protein kinase
MTPEGAPARVVLQNVQLIADALEALHRKGVVHRDLKPENVILRLPDNTPVLVDFGVSFIASFEEGFRSGVVVGTRRYMAPEQLLGGEVDAKADMFSLGVILYEWSNGRLPDYDSDAFDGPGRRGSRRKRPRGTGLAAGIEELTARLLAPDPEERPDARTVARQCERMLENENAGGGGAAERFESTWTVSSEMDSELLDSDEL